MTVPFSKYPLLAPVVPLSVFGICIVLSLYSATPGIHTGITYDLLILAPALYYLAVRKTKIPSITVIPVLFLGIAIAGTILPVESRSHYEILKMLLIPGAELTILGLVGYYTWRTFRQIREKRGSTPDLIELLDSSISEFLPNRRIARILSLEFGGLYYALFVWHRPSRCNEEFSYQTGTGFRPLLYTLIGITLAESLIIHILIAGWSTSVAWTVTAISLYSGLMLLAQAKSMIHRPHRISDNTIELRNGLFGHASLTYDVIDKIRKSDSSEPKEGTRRLAFLGTLEQDNLEIHLKVPCSIEGPYGSVKTCSKLRFHADNPELFMEMLNQKLTTHPGNA